MDEREQTPPAVSMLRWNAHLERWEGHHGDLCMWMSESTFQRYIDSYLEGNFIDHPTEQQRTAAREYCRKMSYWAYARYDREVHFEQVKGNA